MKDVDRILGRLEEFKEQTTQRLEVIEKKIDTLHEFKWRLAGGLTVLSIMLSVILKFWS
jgi:hypothetical protein